MLDYIPNPQLELAIVMLIVPFIVNVSHSVRDHERYLSIISFLFLSVFLSVSVNQM